MMRTPTNSVATDAMPTTNLMLNPGQMITYDEAAALLRVTPRTLRRRVAQGRYIAYGEHSGRRLLYESIIADIQRHGNAAPQARGSSEAAQ